MHACVPRGREVLELLPETSGIGVLCWVPLGKLLCALTPRFHSRPRPPVPGASIRGSRTADPAPAVAGGPDHQWDVPCAPERGSWGWEVGGRTVGRAWKGRRAPGPPPGSQEKHAMVCSGVPLPPLWLQIDTSTRALRGRALLLRLYFHD